MDLVFHFVVSSSDGYGRSVIIESDFRWERFLSLDEVLDAEDRIGKLSGYRDHQIYRFFKDGVIPYGDVRICACV